MGVLSELVIASRSEAASVAESESPTRTWQGVVWKGLDQIKLASVWCLLDSEPLQVDNVVECSMQFELLAETTENGPWVFAVPSACRDKLAELSGDDEGEIQAVVRDWAATDELIDWDQSDVAELLQSIIQLADTAKLEGKDLLLWIDL
jgi:hypothetical protein